MMHCIDRVCMSQNHSCIPSLCALLSIENNIPSNLLIDIDICLADAMRWYIFNCNSIFSEDETWQKHRSAVNKHMMRPHNVVSHTEEVNKVVDEFLLRLTEKLQDGNVITNMQALLFNFTLECKKYQCIVCNC